VNPEVRTSRASLPRAPRFLLQLEQRSFSSLDPPIDVLSAAP
jgi:hypothetical protein